MRSHQPYKPQINPHGYHIEPRLSKAPASTNFTPKLIELSEKKYSTPDAADSEAQKHGFIRGKDYEVQRCVGTCCSIAPCKP